MFKDKYLSTIFAYRDIAEESFKKTIPRACNEKNNAGFKKYTLRFFSITDLNHVNESTDLN